MCPDAAVIFLSISKTSLRIYIFALSFFSLFSAVSRGAFPSDLGEHQPACVVVEHRSDPHPPRHRILANASSQVILRGQETRLKRTLPSTLKNQQQQNSRNFPRCPGKVWTEVLGLLSRQ